MKEKTLSESDKAVFKSCFYCQSTNIEVEYENWKRKTLICKCKDCGQVCSFKTYKRDGADD